MKGTYTGKNGRTCANCTHWVDTFKYLGECHAHAPNPSYRDPETDDPTLPGFGMVMWIVTESRDTCGEFAAKAALDELVGEEAEWVELASPTDEPPYIRISRDGKTVQERSQEGRWNDYDAWWIKEAYRAGCETALRDVQELVEAVKELEYLATAFALSETAAVINNALALARDLEAKS